VAILFDDAASEYLGLGTAPVSAAPCTLAGWLSRDAAAGDFGILGLRDSVGGQNEIWTQIENSTQLVRAATRTSGPTFGIAVTSAATSLNTWQHACAVFASSTSRTAYLDGGNSGSNTTSNNPTSLNVVAVGARATPGTYFSGKLAELAIWDVALTADEVAQLGLGYSPLLVRPGNLVAYWPLYGNNSPETDIVGGVNLTWNNTPTKASDHPRIILPRKRRVYLGTAAGGATEVELMASRQLCMNP
jgi:hypothetical protein